MKKTKVFLLESNLDDVTPEQISHVMDRVMAAGALDIHVLPALMKKGRPGYLIRVLCLDPERFSKILMEETGTLGVRFLEWERFEAKRGVVSKEILFEGCREKIKVKKSEFGSKPEFSDLQRLAKKYKKSLLEVQAEAEKQI